MTFEEIIKQAEQIRDKNCNHSVSREIARLYELNFQKTLNNGCGNCVFDAFIELRSLYKQNKLKTIMTANYKLKDGAIVIRIQNGLKYFNRFSITDELAEIALKENKGLIKYFDKYPSDWLVRCGHAKALSIDAPTKIKMESTIDESVKYDIENQIKEVAEQKKKRGRKAKI